MACRVIRRGNVVLVGQGAGNIGSRLCVEANGIRS